MPSLLPKFSVESVVAMVGAAEMAPAVVNVQLTAALPPLIAYNLPSLPPTYTVPSRPIVGDDSVTPEVAVYDSFNATEDVMGP